ncbi:hypothetical protein BJ944DRAFT_249069 [Cunninghamella echinulata]|nr:hypothetical protein BJ944DRAFT_249069 [Cunninghamella echinulata]
MISKLHNVFILLVVLLSLEQVFGYSNVTVSTGENYNGPSYYCEVTKYQLCHRMEPMTTSMASISSAIYGHKDSNVTEISITFYTGNTCDGEWFRQTGYINIGSEWKIPSFGIYNGQINSFKIANFLTSNGNSGPNQQPPDRKYQVAKCKLIR